MAAPRLASLRLAVHWGALVVVWALASTLSFPSVAYGDLLDDVKVRGKLIWGGDEEGGAPYVYPDPQDPSKHVGFEVDLMNAIAEQLGVKAEFRQTDWDQLPETLNAGQIDVVFNGYELTPDRAARFYCSRPYYAFGLQLVVGPKSKITDWQDLEDKSKGPFSLGALSGTQAEAYLKQDKYSGNVTVTGFKGNVDAFERAVDGQLDGSLQDDCVAYAYADRFPTLRFVGRPVGSGYYTALIRPDEQRFGEAFDAALGKLIASGKLEAIYDQAEMGGRIQSLTLRHAEEVAAGKREGFAAILSRAGPLLLQAAGMTVILAVISMPLAILIGILLALARLYGPWPLRWFSIVYVEVVRGTPLMLQIYAIFFLLPRLIGQMGFEFQMPALFSVILALAVNYSAYEAEIYRSGLQAIPRGQMEAAISLGMSSSQAVRRVILPQAMRLVIPPVTNDFIALFKDTSVCSVVGVVELTKQYNILALSTGAIVELAAITAILYMAMSYPLSILARWSERQIQTDR